MTKHFKALIPFSSYEGIFNPGDTTPGKAPKEMVDAWIEAGYVEEVEAPEQTEVPDAPKKDDADIDKIPVDVIEPLQPAGEQEPAEVTNTPTNDLDVKNEQISVDSIAYETMSYPQLKKAAKDAGIAKYNSMKQIDLVNALKGE